MKKQTLIVLIFMLWASAATAQQEAGDNGPELKENISSGLIGPSYNWVKQDGNAQADEWEYLHSSAGGDLNVEYDPLPQRFDMETHYLNEKDYFGDMDYAYRDVVQFNFIGRGIFHNDNHLTIGPENLTPPSPTFTDLNPNAQYSDETQLDRASIRFKTPDFPFHLYAVATTIDHSGTVQQIFLRGFTGGLDQVSQSRYIDWRSSEVRVGVNSHLGPVEFDYSHMERKFDAGGEQVLYDAYPLFTVPHNEVPDLRSSSDTVKLHTAYTGRLVAAVTFSSGEQQNRDSGATANTRNMAGDLTLTPVAGLVLVVKYRHYELDQSNPDTVTLSGLGSTFAIRTPISSISDVVTGLIRYRFNERLTVKGEYKVETIERSTGDGSILSPLQVAPVPAGTAPNFWDVAHRTTKTTENLNVSYRVMSKLSARADFKATQVANPAYADDPDTADSANVTVTWTPVQRIIALASYGGVWEKRSDLTAPLAGGSLRIDRNQALGSITFLVDRRTSLTASYMYYQNNQTETLTFTDTSATFIQEGAVPYGDTGQVFSLAASHSPAEGVFVTADASRSYSKGNFRVDGTVPGTTGIDSLSDLYVVEDIFTAGLEYAFSKNFGSEFRYQYRHYDDGIDTTQNGTVNAVLATLRVKW
jgi:predicted porin